MGSVPLLEESGELAGSLPCEDTRGLQPARGSSQNPTVLTSSLQSCRKYIAVVDEPPVCSASLQQPKRTQRPTGSTQQWATESQAI